MPAMSPTHLPFQNLALNQELIELDLFHNGLAMYENRNLSHQVRPADSLFVSGFPLPISRRPA